MKTLVLPIAMVCGLAACDGAPTETDQAAAPDAPEIAAPAPPETSTVSPSPAASTIPAVIQGRWGLVAADCEPGRDDAKGLLTISANELDFYESVGTLDDVKELGETRIRADFDFIGQAEPGQRFIGQRATPEAGAAIVEATNSTRLRWVPPRTAVTMEYAFGRVTVSYDDNYAITAVSCS